VTARRLCHGAARVITGPASGVHSVFIPKSESASGEVSVRSRVNTRNMQRVYIERSDWAVVHTFTTHDRPGRPPRRARRPLAPARCRMPPGGDSAPPRRRVRARSRAAAGGPPAAGGRFRGRTGRCGGAGPAAADSAIYRIQHLRRHGVRHAMVCGDRSVYGWVVTDHNVSDTPLTRVTVSVTLARVSGLGSRVRLVPSLCTLNT
jgi:hypothetical protein